MEKIGSAVILICVVLVTCAGYVFYRYDIAKEFQRTGNAIGMAPTICEFNNLDFDFPHMGRMYAYKDVKRVDLILQRGQLKREMRFYKTSDGSAYGTAKDPSDKITEEDARNFDIIQAGAPWQCRPWWIPNSKIVEVPSILLPD